MGTPINCKIPLFTPGADCPHCTPELWLPGKTPKHLSVVFTGVTECPGYDPPPNDIPFTITQSEADPCYWQSGDIVLDAYTIQIMYDASHAYLYLRNKDQAYYWFMSAEPKCTLLHSNVLTCAMGNPGEGGTGRIWYQPDDIPRQLSCSYHLQPLAGTLFERTWPGMDYQVIRLANRNDKTNILVLVDNEEF